MTINSFSSFLHTLQGLALNTEEVTTLSDIISGLWKKQSTPFECDELPSKRSRFNEKSNEATEAIPLISSNGFIDDSKEGPVSGSKVDEIKGIAATDLLILTSLNQFKTELAQCTQAPITEETCSNVERILQKFKLFLDTQQQELCKNQLISKECRELIKIVEVNFKEILRILQEGFVSEIPLSKQFTTFIHTTSKESPQNKELLGSGACGDVIKHTYRNNFTMALKTITYPSSDQREVTRELSHGFLLQHPNIIEFFGITPEKHLAFTVAKETLRQLLQTEKLTNSERKKIFLDLLQALNYLLKMRLTHRDIKPANILMTAKSALVADFGIACSFQDDKELERRRGPPGYIPPEYLSELPLDASKIDIWSLGITLMELLQETFDERSHEILNDQQAFISIKDKKTKFNQMLSESSDQEHQKTIAQLTEQSIVNMIDQSKDPLITKMIKLTLRVFPNDRPNAKEVLDHYSSEFIE